MKDSLKKPKPTLESLLKDRSVVTGKEVIKRAEELDGQKREFDESVEFEKRSRLFGLLGKKSIPSK